LALTSSAAQHTTVN